LYTSKGYVFEPLSNNFGIGIGIAIGFLPSYKKADPRSRYRFR
jgi:hypothetical protein